MHENSSIKSADVSGIQTEVIGIPIHIYNLFASKKSCTNNRTHDQRHYNKNKHHHQQHEL